MPTQPSVISNSVTEKEAKRSALSIAPGVFIAGMAGGMAFPILPLVGLKAGLSFYLIGVILAANRFGRVLSNPVVGVSIDRLGGKRVFVTGLALQVVVLALFIVGVLVGRPGAFFLVGRLLHGPASACVFVSSQALALGAGGSEHRGLTSGIVRSAQVSGIPAGLVFGGLLAGLVGPAGAFGGALVMTLLALPLSIKVMPDLRAAMRERPGIIESFRAIAHPSVAAVAGISCVSSLTSGGVILTTLSIFMRHRGFSLFHLSDEIVSATFMSLLVIFMLVVTPAVARITDRTGRRAPLILVGLVTMVSGLSVIAIARGSRDVAVGIALVGLAGGALTTPLLALVGDIVPVAQYGIATGALQLFGDVGGALGPVVGMAIIQRSDTWTYGISALLVALAIPAALWLLRLEEDARRRAKPPSVDT